jgi:hypothetical protein
VLDDARAMGLPPDEFRIGPEAVLGIEINGYAAELARLTVWITELQWQLRKGLGFQRRPILDRLDGIVRMDALLTTDGKDRPWPEADVVVSNPPFLGDRRMIGVLGERYVASLRATFRDRIPGRSDLVCYWFAKGLDAMSAVAPSESAWSPRIRFRAGTTCRPWFACQGEREFLKRGETSLGSYRALLSE